MALNDESSAGYRFYSLGILIRDKDEGSEWIDVTPTEDFPMELGRLSDSDRVREASTANTAGVSKTDRVQGGSAVRAKWVPLSNPNRDNAPDIYRSETVMLYKYADTQEYYWTTVFREPKLRGRERVRTSLSNQDPGSAYNDTTSYWVEYDTRHKHVKLHTSDNDGEPTTYDFTLNTKAGTFTVEDALGNSIFLDSVAGHLEITTTSSITVNTKKHTLNAYDSATVNTKTYTENVEDVAETNAPKHTLNSDDSQIHGEKHYMTNQLQAVNGFDLSNQKGGNATARIAGDVEIEGNVKATGDIEADGTIIDKGGNTPNHSH